SSSSWSSGRPASGTRSTCRSRSPRLVPRCTTRTRAWSGTPPSSSSSSPGVPSSSSSPGMSVSGSKSSPSQPVEMPKGSSNSQASFILIGTSSERAGVHGRARGRQARTAKRYCCEGLSTDALRGVVIRQYRQRTGLPSRFGTDRRRVRSPRAHEREQGETGYGKRGAEEEEARPACGLDQQARRGPGQGAGDADETCQEGQLRGRVPSVRLACAEGDEGRGGQSRAEVV